MGVTLWAFPLLGVKNGVDLYWWKHCIILIILSFVPTHLFFLPMERLDSDSDAAVLLASDDASDGETNGDLTLDEAKADDMAKAHAMRPGDVSVSLRRSLTVCLSLAFFGLGLVLAMLGPSQRSLAALLNESIGNLAYIFTARSCGYLVGSVVSGWIFERFDALLMLAVTLSVTVIGQFLAPLCPSIALLSCTVVLQGHSDAERKLR